MSHPFGDRLSQHLHRKHGLSQSKLADGILQDPSIIGKMCKGQRLRGPQARTRVLMIINWLREQAALETVSEANRLLAAAGMAALHEGEPTEQMLLQQLAAHALPSSSPVTAPIRRTNLPALLTSFVGRQQELAELAQLVGDKRLVTLTGAGGVGKTRLALEAAKTIFDFGLGIGHLAEPMNWPAKIENQKFQDGVWFVELAALAAPSGDPELGAALVAQAIAGLFKQVEQAGHTTLDDVQEYLADKQLLLVLDNCEHLIDACASICERLLHHCWQLHILTTSREELRIPGEVVYAVLPLALPGPEEKSPDRLLACAAVQLFVDRMRTPQPSWKTQAADSAGLAHICRRLDGIPLALELAAPLTRSLSLAEIATQLDNQMALLTNGYRTAIPRHQTMHNALVWSYRLLAREEQQLLARVSVFVGGWTLAAAAAIWADDVPSNGTTAMVATLLNQLIAKSLVLIETHTQERRYRLLEPVRQFAHAQLVARGEQEAVRRGQAHYFFELAVKMGQARDTPQEREWLLRLEPERNNLRAVNHWAFARNEAQFAQRFNSFLAAFWIYNSNLAEARHWLEGSLTLKAAESDGERPVLALIAEADALNLAAAAAALMCDFTRARTLFERELALRTALDDRRGMANALRGISFALMLSNNNLSEAQQYDEQALAICRAADDRWGIAWSLYDLGYLALVRGQLSTAQALLAEVLPIFYEQGISFGAFRTLLALGHLMRAKSNAVQARQFYADALHLQRQMHYVLHIADGLEGLAALLAAEQKAMSAARLFGAAYAHRRSNALTRPYHQDADYERNVALARSQLDAERWNAAWAAGCAMTLEPAVEYALTV